MKLLSAIKIFFIAKLRINDSNSNLLEFIWIRDLLTKGWTNKSIKLKKRLEFIVTLRGIPIDLLGGTAGFCKTFGASVPINHDYSLLIWQREMFEDSSRMSYRLFIIGSQLFDKRATGTYFSFLHQNLSEFLILSTFAIANTYYNNSSSSVQEICIANVILNSGLSSKTSHRCSACAGWFCELI